jgi:lipopolysaccharide biosynthesis glycosyltransferase
MTKPWRNWFYLYGSDKWWEYVRKSNFFNEINMNFPIHQENKKLIIRKFLIPKINKYNNMFSDCILI